MHAPYGRYLAGLIVLWAVLLWALAGGSGAGPALAKVVVATLPVTDTATAVLAQAKGYLREEGLDLELKLVDIGPATTASIVSGAADLSQSNYATLLSARSEGLPVVFLAEATRCVPTGYSTVIVLPDSPIRSPAELVGKRVATSVIGGIGPFTIAVWMDGYGLNFRAIEWVQMPFGAMGAALQRRQVDAAWVVEPYGTLYRTDLNARVVLDTCSGPTSEIPFAAWATTEQTVRQKGDLLLRFRRAIYRAARLAGTDPNEIRRILPTYTPIRPELASRIALEKYPVATSPVAIQRFEQLMRKVGFLNRPVDVGPMIVK